MITRRFHWEWLVGLALGLGLGLLYAWFISPMHRVEATPASLRADFKEQYRAVIAAAYAASGDLPRAQARLSLLGDPDPVQALSAQAQQMLAQGQPFESVRAVAMLTSALQQARTQVATTDSTPSTFAPSSMVPSTTADTTQTEVSLTATLEVIETPMPLDTPTPTSTPTITPTAPFELISKDEVCDPSGAESLLQVVITDAAGKQLPGIRITIAWSGNEEHFFTGLQPELGDGYADYQMTPGTLYSIRFGKSDTPISNMSAPACQSTDGKEYPGSLRLTFQQP
jgi:hypothetical protein